MLFAISFKTIKLISSHYFKSKNNGPVLFFKNIFFGIKTVSCLLLQQLTKIDVDLNLKNWANFFKF